jgi:hypothetical protein
MIQALILAVISALTAAGITLLIVSIASTMFQEIDYGNAAICFLVLLALLLYVVLAGLLAIVLGTTVFDWVFYHPSSGDNAKTRLEAA